MTKPRSVKKKPRQLYTVLGQLHRVENGQRELGLIVSYAIAKSLLNFESKSGSEEERHHQQVKAIYDGLEEAVDSCESNGSQDTIFTLRVPVDQAIREYIEDSTKETIKSELLTEIFERLSQAYSKNPADRLKRDGIALYHQVMADGIRNRQIDALVGDYKLLKNRLG